MRRVLSLPILLSAWPLSAHADVSTLETVRVPSPPMPGSETVDAETITRARTASSDSASLLAGLPGVNLSAAGGVSSLPTVHGLGDDRLRISVDGMDLVSACANHMNPPLSYIDPNSVEHIEVYTGAVPVSIGGDSIGAAIRVDSAAPRFSEAGQAPRFEGEAGLFHRGNGDGRGAHVAATIAGEMLSLRYDGSTAQSGNYSAARAFKPEAVVVDGISRDAHHIAADEVGSSAYETRNHALMLALRRDAQLWELKAGVQDIPYQGFPNQRMDMTGNDGTHVNLRHSGDYAWGSLEARVHHARTRHTMQFGDDKRYWYGTALNVPGMPMETEGRDSGLDAQAEISVADDDLLRLGIELQRYRLDDWWPPSGTVGGMQPNPFWNIRDGKRDRNEAFVEWDARGRGAWFAQFGLRAANVQMDAGPVQGYNMMYQADADAFNGRDRDRSDTHIDFSALARYAPGPGTRYEFGYAQKSRSPNLYERYAWSTNGMAMRMVNFAGDGNGYVGNLALAPETAHTLSASADWSDAGNERWNLKLAAHYTQVDDFIDTARCHTGSGACDDANLGRDDGFVYLQFVNRNAELYGVDLSASRTLGRSKRLGEFRMNALFGHLEGRDRDSNDGLYHIMPTTATLQLQQRLRGWSGILEWQLVDAKRDVSRVRNESTTPGYTLVHLRGSYEWSRLRIDAGIENLFDRFYRHPLGGAYLGQGATMSGTAVAWGNAVPGMGRSLNTGITYTF